MLSVNRIKQNIRILIVLVIVSFMLVYCWGVIIATELIAVWRHYLGLLFFLAVAVLFLKKVKVGVIATGIYLLLASFNIIALTPTITTSSFQIGPVSTPGMQLLSLGVFILYFLLNMDNIINIYLDYKGVKKAK